MNISASTLTFGVYPRNLVCFPEQQGGQELDLGAAAADLLYLPKKSCPEKALKSFIVELQKTACALKEALSQKELSSEEASHLLWDLDHLPDYLETAQFFLASYGLSLSEQAKQIRGILQSMREWEIPQLQRGFLGKAVGYFFDNPKENFLQRLSAFQRELPFYESALAKGEGQTALAEKQAKDRAEEEEANREMPLGQKRFFNALFCLLQLSQEAIRGCSKEKLSAVYQKASEQAKNVSKEVEKEAALIGNLLTDKKEALKNDQAFKSLTKRHPQVRALLDAIRQGKLSCTPQEAMEAYKTYRSLSTLLSPSKWIEAFWGTEAVEAPRSIKPITPSQSPPSCPTPAKSEIASLQNGVAHLKRDLRMQCAPQPIWQLKEACVSLQMRERELKQSMQKVRSSLLPSEAELQKYGPKHSNLVRMECLVQALEIDTPQIPAPRGISSEQIQAFLERNAPEVFTQWQKLKELREKNSQGALFDDPEAVEALQDIEQGIEQAFAQDQVWEQLQVSNELKTWQKEMAQAGHFLMVRSTGSEDSSQIANAGGNESRAYIPAEPKALSQAIGDVVKSYFSQNSLQIRLSGGTNPFEESLSLAVTMQQLIGEPVGGAEKVEEIPVSFVLFTNEPLYIGKEKFRAMRISATYGHGEAVVKNQGISTDSILVLVSERDPTKLYFIYDNQKKPSRLAPVRGDQGKITLQSISNPVELQNKRVLSDFHLAELYRSGVLIEAFFHGHSTDIEGVIRKGKLYFVQARPVNRKPLLPTYFAAEKGVIKKSQAEMIVPGKASVVTVKKPEEIIFASTLDEAQEIFGKKDLKAQSQVKLVIVIRPEPENSHAVVNFSGLMMPCLYTTQPEEIGALIQEIGNERSLVACMQTATFFLCNETIAPVQEQIREGFAVHPAKIAPSLPFAVPVENSPPASSEVVNLLRQMRDPQTTPPKALELLDRLEAHPELYFLKAKAASFKERKLPQAARTRARILIHLYQKVKGAIEEMRAVLKSDPEGRLHSLLHAKILESWLLGRAPGPGRYSLRNLRPLAQEIETLIQYQKELSFPAQGGELLLAVADNPEALPHWRKFLLQSERLLNEGKISQQEWDQFKALIETMKQTEVLTFWLTFFQGKALSSLSLEIHLAHFKQMLNEANPAAMRQIEMLKEKQETLEQFSRQKERFADSRTFSQAWQELQHQIETFSSPDWISLLISSSPLVQSIAYRTMEKLVDLVDQSIKSVKASQIADRAQRVKQMLFPFFQMMRTWVEGNLPRANIPTHAQWPLSTYLNSVKRLLDHLRDNSPAELLASPGFSVSAARLGAGTALERHKPERLEDMLTLIHQNCLVLIEACNQQLLSSERIQQSLLPEHVQKAMRRIEQGQRGRAFQRIGVEMRRQEIVVRYNVPLRNHSGHLDLHYNQVSGKMVLKGQLLGRARERWSETAYWISALEAAEILTLDQPLFQNAQELSFSWEITLENLEIAIQEYAAMADYSLGLSNLPDAMEAFIARFTDRLKVQQQLVCFFSHPHKSMFDYYLNRIRLGKEEELEVILAIAKNWIPSISFEVKDLYCALLEKYPKAAEELSALALRQTDPSIGLLSLLAALIESGSYKEAFAFMQKSQLFEKERDWLIQPAFRELFRALVKAGKAPQTLVESFWEQTQRQSFFGEFPVLPSWRRAERQNFSDILPIIQTLIEKDYDSTPFFNRAHLWIEKVSSSEGEMLEVHAGIRAAFSLLTLVRKYIHKENAYKAASESVKSFLKIYPQHRGTHLHSLATELQHYRKFRAVYPMGREDFIALSELKQVVALEFAEIFLQTEQKYDVAWQILEMGFQNVEVSDRAAEEALNLYSILLANGKHKEVLQHILSINNLKLRNELFSKVLRHLSILALSSPLELAKTLATVLGGDSFVSALLPLVGAYLKLKK